MDTLSRIFLGCSIFLLVGCGVHKRVVLSEADTGIEIPKDNPGDKTDPGTDSGKDDDKEPPPKAVFMEGRFPVLGGEVDFKDVKDKPLVVAFSGVTCDVCIAEAETFRDSLKDGSVAPNKVNLLTILVGGVEEDAQTWKRHLELPWAIGWDKQSTLFKKYCGNSEVPCIFVQTPKKGIVFKKIGKVSLEKLKQLTGPWED